MRILKIMLTNEDGRVLMMITIIIIMIKIKIIIMIIMIMRVGWERRDGRTSPKFREGALRERAENARTRPELLSSSNSNSNSNSNSKSLQNSTPQGLEENEKYELLNADRTLLLHST